MDKAIKGLSTKADDGSLSKDDYAFIQYAVGIVGINSESNGKSQSQIKSTSPVNVKRLINQEVKNG